MRSSSDATRLDFSAPHPTSKKYRNCYLIQFIILVTLITIHYVKPPTYSSSFSKTSIAWRSSWLGSSEIFALVIHITFGCTMWGLLFDPWHDNLIRCFQIYQLLNAIVSLIIVIWLIVLLARYPPSNISSSDKNAEEDGRLRLILEAAIWIVHSAISLWVVIRLYKSPPRVAEGNGCCPVLRCPYCRAIGFLHIPLQHYHDDIELVSTHNLSQLSAKYRQLDGGPSGMSNPRSKYSLSSPRSLDTQSTWTPFGSAHSSLSQI